MTRWMLLLAALTGCDRLFGLAHLPDVPAVDGHADSAGDGSHGFCSDAYASGTEYPVAMLARDVTLADVDGVNGLDVLATGYGDSKVAILLNRGDGTFDRAADVTTLSKPTSVIAVDVIGNAALDLIVADAGANSLSEYQGNGDGTFTSVGIIATGTNSAPVALAAGKIDANNTTDVVAAAHGTNVVAVYTNNGTSVTPQPTVATAAGPQDVALADLDHDAKLDMIVANYDGNSVATYHGNGNGTFAPASVMSVCGAPTHVAVGRFDADNFPDVAVSCGDGHINVLFGLGDGGLRAPLMLDGGAEVWSIAVSDLDGDVFPDLAFPQYTNMHKLRIFHGGANGFGPPEDFAGYGEGDAIAIGDLDGVPPNDIVVGNWTQSTVAVYLGCKP